MVFRVLVVAFVLFLSSIGVSAQQFESLGAKLADFNEKRIADTFSIFVDGMSQSIDCSFGLERVCIDLLHARTSDLKITLVSPDGTEIWVSNRNGTGRNYINTCFEMNGFGGFVHAADNPFQGSFIPNGSFEALNNGQNPNGKWLLVVEDLKEGIKGALSYVRLSFGEDVACKNSVCSFESPKGCTRCKKSKELLPDIVLLEELTKKENDLVKNEDGQYEYRFTAAMANIGMGPLEIRRDKKLLESYKQTKDSTRINVYQHIYSLEKRNKLTRDSVVAGTIYYDSKPGHDHYHMDDWVHFSIRRKTDSENPDDWEEIARTDKMSYCLFDTHYCEDDYGNCKVGNEVYGENNLDNFGLGGYFNCEDDIQGISVGGMDYYGVTYEGQSIVLPDELEVGEYFLVYNIDPKGYFREICKDNNRNFIKIDMSLLQ